MSEQNSLQADLDELVARIDEQGFVRLSRDGDPDLIATLYALPTLAERGRLDEVRRVAAAVFDVRDEEGGWDNPWVTVLAVEALVALKLRNVPVSGLSSALEFATNVLRSAPALDPMERELRLARAVILAGMARQESATIDAGILRIHGLLDRTSAWSADLSEAVHGLLSLADLTTISNDQATRELVEKRLVELGLESPAIQADELSEDLLARLGCVMIKLNRSVLARELLHRATRAASDTCDSITLKHRIELAARLQSHEMKTEVPARETPETSELSQAPGSDTDGGFSFSLERGLELMEDLPRFWRAFPSAAPKNLIQVTILNAFRAQVYQAWTEANRPLVSLMLDLLDETANANAALESVLDTADEVPFELLACVFSSVDGILLRRLNELGAFIAIARPNEARDDVLRRAASQAKAPYLTLVSAGSSLQENWLPQTMARFLDNDGNARMTPPFTRKGLVEKLLERIPEEDERESEMTVPPQDSKAMLPPAESSEEEVQTVEPGEAADQSVETGEAMSRLLAQADALIRDGEYGSAESALVDLEPNLNGNVHERVLFWTLLGDTRFRLDRPDEAYQCYRKAVSDDPSSERAWIGIGAYHMIRDEYDLARTIFNKVLELNPSNRRGHLGLGNSYLKEERPHEALPHFQQALKIDPTFRHAVVGLIAAAVQTERMGEAVSGLTAYIERCPDDVEVRFHLAAIFFGTNQPEAAREHAERVLQVNPDHSGAKQILEHLAGAKEAE